MYEFCKTPNGENTKQLNDIYAQVGKLFLVLEVVRPAIEVVGSKKNTYRNTGVQLSRMSLKFFPNI